MIKRIRTIVPAALGTALLASGLGLAAFALASTANAGECVRENPDGSFSHYYCY